MPRIHYGIVGYDATLSDLPPSLTEWWREPRGGPCRLLSLKLRLGGFASEAVLRAFPDIWWFSLSLLLGLVLAAPLYFLAPIVPLVAGIALIMGGLYFVFIDNSQSEEVFYAKTAFLIALFIVALATISWLAFRSNALGSQLRDIALVATLFTSAFLLYWVVLFWPRDIGRIFLFILRPGDSFPLVKPANIPKRTDVILALRLFSPAAVRRYLRIETRRQVTWVYHRTTNRESSLPLPLTSSEITGLNEFLREDLWGVCRYVLRGYMEAADSGNVDEDNRLGHDRSAWWKHGQAAYFTAKLHMTQLKSYALLLAIALTTAGLYAAHHRTADVKESSCGHSPPTTLCIQDIVRDFYDQIDSVKESKANKQVPVALAGLGIMWALGSWYYRGHQLRRVSEWEDYCRGAMSNEGLQLFHFLPDADGQSRWYEVDSDKDIRTPIGSFGLNGAHVFHVVDGVMLVLLLELLHILHF